MANDRIRHDAWGLSVKTAQEAQTLLCGPVMLAMVAAHSLPLMIGGSAAVWWEQRHPRAWRDPVPVVVLAATAVGLVVAAEWPGH
jgi:hypothetical protein